MNTDHLSELKDKVKTAERLLSRLESLKTIINKLETVIHDTNYKYKISLGSFFIYVHSHEEKARALEYYQKEYDITRQEYDLL